MTELTPEEFDRWERVMLYVMYYAEEMRIDGLIHVDWALSDEGMDSAKKLVDSGFEPTGDELQFAMFQLNQECGFTLKLEREEE